MHEKRNNMTAFTSVRRTALGALTIIAGALLVMPAQAQNYPISSSQRATAQQVSERGVPKLLLLNKYYNSKFCY